MSTSKKIDKMLQELKQEKTGNVLQHPDESQPETSSAIWDSESENETNSIKKVEEAFQNLELKRITNKKSQPSNSYQKLVSKANTFEIFSLRKETSKTNSQSQLIKSMNGT